MCVNDDYFGTTMMLKMCIRRETSMVIFETRLYSDLASQVILTKVPRLPRIGPTCIRDFDSYTGELTLSRETCV